MSGLATAPAHHQRQRLPFTVDVPFAKDIFKGTKGDLELVGYASTWVMDRDGEFVDPRAFDNSLPAYLEKNPMLLWQHNMDWPLGTIVEARVDANGLAVRAVVRQPAEAEERWKHTAYNDIKAGIVRTFSIGGFFTRDFVPGVGIIITEVELLEISVVSIPSNPDSIFEAAVKAVKGGTARPQLPQRVVDQMQQLLGLVAMSDPELLRMDDDAKEARYTELCGLYHKAGKVPPGRTVFEEAQQEANPRERLAKVLDVMQLALGQVDDTKAGRVLSKSNEDALRRALDGMEAAVGDVRAVLAQLPDPTADGEDDPGKTAGIETR